MWDGPIIDCDIHHSESARGDICGFLPQRWREYVGLPNGLQQVSPPIMTVDPPGGTNSRLDSFPANGTPPGSDYATLREQVLDPYPIQRAVLSTAGGGAIANPELSDAMSVATNDWCVERWLDAHDDERVCAALVVPTHSPELGAAEIRRAGAHPKFVAAQFLYNALGKPLGHPLYHPIYEAAADEGLPIYIHANPGEIMGSSGPFQGGGSSLHYRFEVFMFTHQATANHLVSLMMAGVFDRFPGLNVICAESGLSWIPSFAAHLDSNYELMRRESNWIRRRPSEYLREHVLFTTQPCEALLDGKQEMIEHLSLVEGIEDMLAFSTDYPHWDSDAPSFVAGVFPTGWHERIFYGNASRSLRLPATHGMPRAATRDAPIV